MIYDLLVIGGGINGSGIACDAAGRGLSVYLCEMNDFASGTSSKSSQLIHGGLRYLESLDFKLVYESLKERDVMLNKAPHLVKPQVFVMPFNSKIRSAWMIKAGLWLYSHLAKTQLPKSTSKLSKEETQPLKNQFQKGVQYYDCWVDDARLVINNLIQAKSLGASVHNYQACTAIKPQGDFWQVTLLDKKTNQTLQVKAKSLVNATGPWADMTNHLLPNSNSKKLSLVQGSHLIVNKWYSGNQAYILQNADGRVVFVIPLDKHAIIGTTDRPFSGDLNHIKISAQEQQYLLDSVNHYFNQQFSRGDVIESYSGVRPLYDDGEKNLSKVSRDYHLEKIYVHNLPYITVYGGKLTTYRILAEETLEKLNSDLSITGKKWTEQAKFPSANFDKFENLYHSVRDKYQNIPESLLSIFTKRYGSDIWRILNNVQFMADLGQQFGQSLFAIEVDYFLSEEWAHCADDIIWRRTKAGLELSSDDNAKLKEYINAFINSE